MAPHPRRTRIGLLAAVALLALLVGCSADGSGDGSGDSATPTSTTPSTAPDDDETTMTTDADEADEADDGDGESGGGSLARDAYVEAVADAMREVEDTDFPIDDDQADCLAPRWVDAIGYETLLDAGVTPEVLGGSEDGDTTAEFEDVVDRPRAERLVDAFGDCGIDLESFFYDGLASDGSTTPEQVDCIRDRLPDGFIRELLITSMDGGEDALDADPDLSGQLTGAFMACLDEG